MPVTFIAFLIGAISIIGLPPLIGVWSKWWIGIGAAETGDTWAIAVLMISSLLNVAYLLPILSRGFFLAPKGQDPNAPVTRAEAPMPILIAMTITSILAFLLFLIPNEIQTLLAPIVEAPNGQ
jgi:multicomponent Na+:H+ antiporter subunit D